MKDEIELKFEIEQCDVSKTLTSLKAANCAYIGVEFHDDYVPDLPKFLMKEQKELVRFRHVRSPEDTYWLTTYKKKVSTDEYQHYQEIEADSRYTSYENDLRAIEIKINPYTPKDTLGTINLNDDVVASHKSIIAAGLSEIRIHSQKIRHVFEHTLGEVTIDIFPHTIGSFIEIEAESRDSIDELCTRLRLPIEQKISEDYGEVIKERHANREYPNNRIALFETDRLHTLLAEYNIPIS